MERVGRVSQLWRYPVKSMLGSQLQEAKIIWTGVLGDRLWVVRRASDDVVVTAKMKEGQALLRCQVLSWVDTKPVFRLSEGKNYLAGSDVGNRVLSELLEQSVYMDRVDDPWEGERPTNYRPPFSLRPGVGVDSSPIHLLTSASLQAMQRLEPASDFAVERFRPNVVVIPDGAEGFVEDQWVGRVLQVGRAQLYGRRRTDRCPEPTQAQPGLPHDPKVLRAITVHHGKDLGIYLTVVMPGAIGLGDEVLLVD